METVPVSTPALDREGAMRKHPARTRLGALAMALGWVAATAGVAAATAAQTADVTGTWRFTVELDIGGGEPTFVFEQDGETLAGTYDGLFGAAEVTGTVKGEQIEFRFGTSGVEAVYVGTVDGDNMKGTCDYGGVAEGTWEAQRQ